MTAVASPQWPALGSQVLCLVFRFRISPAVWGWDCHLQQLKAQAKGATLRVGHVPWPLETIVSLRSGGS